MKQQPPEDFQLFFQELPQSDYLDDIEIDDDFDDAEVKTSRGLSEEQVSEIARDSLESNYTPFNAATSDHSGDITKSSD